MKLSKAFAAASLAVLVAMAPPALAREKPGPSPDPTSKPAKKPTSKPSSKPTSKPTSKPAAKFSDFEIEFLKRLKNVEPATARKLRQKLPTKKSSKAKTAYVRKRMHKLFEERNAYDRLYKKGILNKAKKAEIAKLRHNLWQAYHQLGNLQVFYELGRLPKWYVDLLKKRKKKTATTQPTSKPTSKPTAPEKPKSPQKPKGSTSQSPDTGNKGAVPETAVIRLADKPDLRGCGLGPSQELKDLGYQFPLAQPRWQSGFALTPCSALSGGYVPDLNAYCQSYFGDGILHWLPEGRPICRPWDYVPDAADARGYAMVLPNVCAVMYPDQDSIRRGRINEDGELVGSGHLYPIVKLQDRRVECFYLDIRNGSQITVSNETAGSTNSEQQAGEQQ